MRLGLGRFFLSALLIGVVVFIGLALATAATQVPARIIVLCAGLAALTALSMSRLARIPVLPNRAQHLAAAAAVGGVAIIASVFDTESSAVPFVVAFLALVTMAGLARDVGLGVAGTHAVRPWNGSDRRAWDGVDRRGDDSQPPATDSNPQA